ncbi:MAG TPA: hypothetical protein VK694_00415 [Verrucomicrobiae bacterium]|nr:hypothetical protein [Verrucomicrobiae bacterium]
MIKVSFSRDELREIGFAVLLDRETVIDHLEKEPDNTQLQQSLQMINGIVLKVNAAINKPKEV